GRGANSKRRTNHGEHRGHRGHREVIQGNKLIPHILFSLCPQCPLCSPWLYFERGSDYPKISSICRIVCSSRVMPLASAFSSTCFGLVAPMMQLVTSGRRSTHARQSCAIEQFFSAAIGASFCTRASRS